MRVRSRYQLPLLGVLLGLLGSYSTTTTLQTLEILSLAFAPSGNALVVGGLHFPGTKGATVQLWHPQRLDIAPRTLPEQNPVYATAFSSDGYTVATIHGAYEVRLWNSAAPNTAPVILAEHLIDLPLTAIQFSPNGTLLVAGGAAPNINMLTLEFPLYVWDIGQPAAKPRRLKGPDSDVTGVAFSPDGHWLAAATTLRKVYVWNMRQADAPPVVLVRSEGEYGGSIAFSSDNHTLAAASRYLGDPRGSSDDKVFLWDVRQPAVAPKTIDTPQCHIRALAIDLNKSTVAVGCYEGTIELWDLSRTTVLPVVLHSGQSAVQAVAFSPDGYWLATGTSSGVLQVRNLQLPGATPAAVNVP